MRGLRERLAGLGAPRALAPLALGACGVILAVIVISGLGGGGGESAEAEAEAQVEPEVEGLATVGVTRTSWADGQGSLVARGPFATLHDRAVALARTRVRERERLLASLLEDRQKATGEVDKAALRAYRRAKRQAEREYQQALAAAEAERRRQERELAREKRKAEKELEEFREENKIPPGEECSIPEVRKQFDCETGYPF